MLKCVGPNRVETAMMPRSKSHREHIVIHAWYRRHRIARADVVSVDVGTLWEGEAGWRWYPKLRLRDGSQVWIRALDLGRAGKPVQDEEMKVVYELCQLLGVSGEVGASRRMADEHLRARPFHGSGAGTLRVPWPANRQRPRPEPKALGHY